MSMHLDLFLHLQSTYVFGGEAGVVTIKGTIHAKLQDKGVTCILVGYARHHAGDVYEMWNPTTSSVHTTRDITSLNRMFYQQVVSPTTGAYIQQAGESDKWYEKHGGKKFDNQKSNPNVEEKNNEDVIVSPVFYHYRLSYSILLNRQNRKPINSAKLARRERGTVDC